MFKMQPDNHHFRLNITTDKKYILRPEKNGFVVQNPLLQNRNMKPLELRDQWGHSGTSKSGWIRLCASSF